MVHRAIAKADVLIEAMAWIRRFRDKVTVIKLGGSLLDNEHALRHILLDVVFMETVGMRPVIVHGGGAAISRELKAAGIEPRFVHGRRVTDEQTLPLVEKALVTQLNHHIADQIEQLGGRAMTLNFAGTNVLFGQRLQPFQSGLSIARTMVSIIRSFRAAGPGPPFSRQLISCAYAPSTPQARRISARL